MRKRKVRRLAPGMVVKIRDCLGLSQWKVSLTYGEIAPGMSAEAVVSQPYRRIDITLNPREINNESDLANTIRHELLHAFAGEFYGCMDGVVESVNEEHLIAIAPFVSAAGERLVNDLEHLLDCGLGVSPEDMLK